MAKIFFLFFITKTAIAIMEIQKPQKISFQAFYRHSPSCMHYLEKNFDGSKMRFNKAIEILDKRCSKHKYFDMFFSPENNSIKILPKDISVEKYLLNGRYMTILQSERYAVETVSVENKLQENSNNSFFKKFLKMFSFGRAKKIINPYYKLPSNVREAVDIIEKIEHSIV